MPAFIFALAVLAAILAIGRAYQAYYEWKKK